MWWKKSKPAASNGAPASPRRDAGDADRPPGTSTSAPGGANGATPRVNGAAPSSAAAGGEIHIYVEDVRKQFGRTLVLRGITMKLYRKQTAVIIGGSGAGKTTLLRLLIGLERPSSGHIWVDGEDISFLDDYQMNRVRQKFGMVFQYAALLDSLTVLENVAFPLREHRKQMSNKEVRERVVTMLNSLGLENKENRMPSELSGGQRKRVGLARALMLEPEIIVYDEPTSGLDPHTSRTVDDLIEKTRDEFNVTSIVISHDMTSTFRIAHQAFLLIDGMVAAEGTPDYLANGDNEVARKFIRASGVDYQNIERITDGGPTATDEPVVIRYNNNDERGAAE
jgi:phospholipid/cholesterol/gamma-HCH transport system ATP-binding protein